MIAIQPRVSYGLRPHALQVPGLISSRCQWALAHQQCAPCVFSSRPRRAPQESNSKSSPGGYSRQTKAQASPSNDQPLSADSPAASVERQNERALAYALLSGALGVLGLLQAALPQYIVEYSWLACATPVVSGLLRLLGGSYLLAAVAAYCLKEAAEHDRLKSDTYQRLNLGIMWWALGSIVTVWLAPVHAQPLVQWAWTALMAFAAVTSAATYHATSPEGLSPVFLLARLLESAGATWDPSSFTTAAYGIGALLTGFGATAILVGKLPVLQAPQLAAPMGVLGKLFLKLTAVGMLLSCICWYTQKDAAARGRLGASTFRSLNAGLAMVCLNNLVVLSSWLRDGLVQMHGLRSPVVTASAALLGVSLWNYFLAKKK